MAKIELQDLQFAYPGKSFNLAVKQQVFADPMTAIVGQNGAGKSTIFKLLTGLLQPDTGIIKVDGHDLADFKPVDRLKTIGITFQNPDDQLFNATVKREVEWSLSQVNDDRDANSQQADKVLANVGLAEKAAENPYDLSLSERKLLTIATVLAIDPEIYLFDEPMISLDSPSKLMLTQIFHELVADGHQVITITHDMDWVAAEFGAVCVMEHGRIQFTGTPRALFGDRGLVERVGLLPPKVMELTSMLGDSRVYLSPEDYYKQNLGK
ncbi:ABC transporter ATP-binding protein [Lentilactobacillus otakiensis]|uniref:ABC superfamily ATP binding cassette transporter, ABC protein n=1 Tax=Lentilactobacillus otakiensis DSM 19908 = JCM 15040 TaxID=1423780 RepID=S4NJY2_9LACO|nr:ABC transporter ATP-binding protein [Lentilactobacillus otakiensis]KRL09927.1 ABC transporter-like protein [Lentilactobacillus otakiensis DSM 19908 = JCM 15040]MBZ3776301.1 energy-coupling factor ABC transporter ATP-binding protein [Lentilactobacillus otakiensis]MDV3517275.1 ABC transporter ATP-binding protein [Lentilactobacillus otakiensis]GAD17597.1 ABC superfamily ATP binding cassette transporter, ABC protein [Lentilactobacillus otakiensis DSM 19908 = JCM 15040]